MYYLGTLYTQPILLYFQGQFQPSRNYAKLSRIIKTLVFQFYPSFIFYKIIANNDNRTLFLEQHKLKFKCSIIYYYY